MAGKRILVLSLFALVALTLAVFASSSTEAGSYKPQNIYTVVNPAANVASNNSMTLTIPAPDYNYEDSSMYSFTPVDWQVPMGGELPFVAGVGTLSSTSTLGTFNGPCLSDVGPLFNLWNASTDITATLTPAEMAWTNTANPIPTGTYVAGIRDYLVRYPHFLNLMLDPDGPSGPKPPLTPRARYAGDTDVVGSNMLIQVVVLSPGQIAELPGIKAQMVAGMGYVFLTALNNPIDQEEKPGSVSDFCTPLQSVTTFYGTTTDNPATAAINESGYTATKNPLANSGVLASGTHITRNYSHSERDQDADGFENDLDPCPYTADPLWLPRVSCVVPGPGDTDCDGLPNSCDPVPGTLKTDQDDDGYNNRQDICPLVKNGTGVGEDNQSDEDGKVLNADLGPSPDSIGDVCDDSDDDGNEDGAGAGTCNDGIDNVPTDGLIDGNDPSCIPSMDAADATPWGTNPGTGLYYQGMAWAAVCIGGADPDGDGYCTALENALGSSPTAGGETVCNEAPATCVGGPPNPCDNDADTYVNDGCWQVGDYAESGAECLNAISDDTPSPDNRTAKGEVALGVAVNDGCKAVGVPESLVIDAVINAPGAVPAGNAPASCNDGLDNDGDTYVDANDPLCIGMNPVDPDKDGIPSTNACEGMLAGTDAGSPLSVTAQKGGTAAASDMCLVFKNGAGFNTGTVTANASGCAAPTSVVAGTNGGGENAVCVIWASACVDPGESVTIQFKATTAPGGGFWTVWTLNGNPTPADKCPNVWNPEQRDTDTKSVGDACDNDDDNDGFKEQTVGKAIGEWQSGSDPLKATSTPDVCDGVNNDLDLKPDGTALIDEGFVDTNSDGTPDCMENDAGQCAAPYANCDVDGDTVTNGTDLNDDTSPNGDPFTDAQENYMGTNKNVMCSVGGADNDPLDMDQNGKANILDLGAFFAEGEYGTKVANDDQAYKRRLDMDANKQINILDLGAYFALGQYGKTCPYGLPAGTPG